MKDSYLPQIKKIIARNLDLSEYRLFLFGSRASGKNAEYSDFDIGVIGEKPLPSSLKINIEGDLEDSDIPMKVDIVDFYQMPEKFKNVAFLRKIDL